MVLLVDDRPLRTFLILALIYGTYQTISVQSWSPATTRVDGSAAVRKAVPSTRHLERKNAVISLRSSTQDDWEVRGEENDKRGKPFTQQSTARPRNNKLSRREVLATTCGLVTAGVVVSQELPNMALAAEPVTPKDTDSILAIAKRKLRPKPPKILRRKLSQDFAVLLMRSSYNALDEMDCVAMDQFQRDFFLIRLAEYETYKTQLGDGMVQQGDLTDPFYFDFISFAQYKTINREVTQDPPYVFEEQQIPPEGGEISPVKPNGTARFVAVVVQRDPALTNALLVPTHKAKVGAAVLDKIELTFKDTESKIPDLGYQPDAMALLSGLRQIVNIFLINGYAFKGDIGVVAGGAGLATYQISLSAPATLWSGTVLQKEGDPLDNDFLGKTLEAYVRKCGYETTKAIKYEGSNLDLTLTVR